MSFRKERDIREAHTRFVLLHQGTIEIPLTIEQIILHEQTLEEAFAPQSVFLTLKDHIDLGRGDMLVDPQRPPVTTSRFIAELIWMSDKPLKLTCLT